MHRQDKNDNVDNPLPAAVHVETASTSSTSETGQQFLEPPDQPLIRNSYVPRQTIISQFITKPMTLSISKAIDAQITKFIVKHFHPFSHVEETEFQNLIKMLAPNYVIPSRKTISNNVLLQMYENTLENVKKDLCDVTALELTTDGWTSINNQHFIALTVHFINSETKLCSRLLGCINYNERSTSQELATFLMNTVKNWNIENKISAVVTDNAANIKAAVKQNN